MIQKKITSAFVIFPRIYSMVLGTQLLALVIDVRVRNLHSRTNFEVYRTRTPSICN